MTVRSIRFNKKRFMRNIGSVLGLIAAVLILSAFADKYAGKCTGNTDATATEYTVYTVQNGDTLWSIAEACSRNEVDIREVIFDIKSVNGMEKSAINSGDVLLVPTK